MAIAEGGSSCLFVVMEVSDYLDIQPVSFDGLAC